MLEIICVPIIVAIVFLLMEAYKKWIAKGREKFNNFIPVISGVLGLILGIILYFVAPNLVVASNVWVAMLIGACSGLSATGCNQIFKQLKKFGVEVKQTNNVATNVAKVSK